MHTMRITTEVYMFNSRESFERIKREMITFLVGADVNRLMAEGFVNDLIQNHTMQLTVVDHVSQKTLEEIDGDTDRFLVEIKAKMRERLFQTMIDSDRIKTTVQFDML